MKDIKNTHKRFSSIQTTPNETVWNLPMTSRRRRASLASAPNGVSLG